MLTMKSLLMKVSMSCIMVIALAITSCAQQQKTDQDKQVLLEKKISDRLNRLGLIVACLSVITQIMLFGIARLVKWI